MKIGFAACLLVWAGIALADESPDAPEPRWGIALHGGARNLAAEDYTVDELLTMQAELRRAADAGHAVLAGGGSSLDAVQAAIVLLEDSPWFNAGKGAVFTHEGRNELDASLMDGRSLKAGAVAGLQRIRNPIELARLVMERSPHVMLAGEGAEAFAIAQGVKPVEPKYFHTERAWKRLQKALDEEKHGKRVQGYSADRFGTVGAVALDRQGNLAAGTSTGGMTNKRHGRIGDSPVIGAGTYANNASCAVSATGHGEYFIRYTVAHDICARVQYARAKLADSADAVVMRLVKDAGGEGGVIAMDAHGNVAMPFNTNAMFRAWRGKEGPAWAAVGNDPAPEQAR